MSFILTLLSNIAQGIWWVFQSRSSCPSVRENLWNDLFDDILPSVFSSYLDVGSLDLISHFLTSSLIFDISQCCKVYILGDFLLLQLSRLLVNGFSFLLFNFQELLCLPMKVPPFVAFCSYLLGTLTSPFSDNTNFIYIYIYIISLGSIYSICPPSLCSLHNRYFFQCQLSVPFLGEKLKSWLDAVYISENEVKGRKLFDSVFTLD